MSMTMSKPKIDVEYPDVTTKILTFGSCHNNKSFKPGQPVIWDAISALKPDTFLWTGDTVYSSKKSGISSPALLQEQYTQMANNETIGYSTFLSNGEVEGYLKGGVHGTWDDHDYGANDHGMQMPNRKERQNLLLDFLGIDEKDARREREGIYSSVTFGKVPQKVKVVFLDTRSARSKHCIPSVGAMPIPMASAFACITRWITAGLNLQEFIPRCKNGKILDDAQWAWLEEQMLGTDAQVNILVSSIQVLSSNPLMETWGQFPSERNRLLSILNKVEEGKSVVVLSGDVHHAEILDSSTGVHKSTGRTIEVTSSGLTHRSVLFIVCRESLFCQKHTYLFIAHNLPLHFELTAVAKTHFMDFFVNLSSKCGQSIDTSISLKAITTPEKTLVRSKSIGLGEKRGKETR